MHVGMLRKGPATLLICILRAKMDSLRKNDYSVPRQRLDHAVTSLLMSVVEIAKISSALKHNHIIGKRPLCAIAEIRRLDANFYLISFKEAVRARHDQ